MKEKRGKGRPKVNRETKKRISLAILPSLYDDLSKIAFVKRESISEIVSDLIKGYIKKNKELLAEYDNIKGDDK